MHFSVVASGSRASLQFCTLAVQTKNQKRLTKTILPAILTIYSTTVIISHICGVSIIFCQPICHCAVPVPLLGGIETKEDM